MALPNKEKYEQRKIDNLIQYLRLYRQKEQPIDFEILVDGFKAVRRTSDPEMFSMFENFVTADTQAIEVLLYQGTSNNNEKRIFYFGDLPKEKPKEEALSGVDVQNMVNEQVKHKLQEIEFKALQDENKELKHLVAELEKEIDEIEKQNIRLEARQSPLNGFLGDIGSSLVESFVKRNPKLMSAIPGGEALAGLLEQSESENENEALREFQVSFKAKADHSTQTSPISVDDRAAIQFVDQLKAQFTKEEFDNVLLILQTLADDKSKISLILNHVNIKQQS